MANSADPDQLKPTDLDLHCLQNRVHLGSAEQELTQVWLLYQYLLVEKSALSIPIFFLSWSGLFIENKRKEKKIC